MTDDDDDDGMVSVRVPRGSSVLIQMATADAVVTKAADLQPEPKE